MVGEATGMGTHGGKRPREFEPTAAGRILGNVLLGALLLTGCTDAADERVGGSEDADAGRSASCDVTADVVAEIGSVEDPASIVSTVAVDVERLLPDGWVVAGAGDQVVEYSEDGTFIDYATVPGDGPGEIADPRTVALDPTDSLWVSRLRGRALVIDPDEGTGRTVVDPALASVDGHTPSGYPYSVRVRLSNEHSLASQRLFGVVQVHDREGDSLYSMGPGAGAGAGPRPVRLTPFQGVAALTDTTFLAWSSNDAMSWVTLWTRDGEEELVPIAAVLERLGLDEIRRRWDHLRAVDVVRAEDGGAWTLGRVRRMPREQELALRDSLASDMGIGPPGSPEITSSSQLMNRVYDGVLVRLGPRWQVLETSTVEEFPWGFVDGRHFYTMVQRPTGVLQIKIWRFQSVC